MEGKYKRAGVPLELPKGQAISILRIPASANNKHLKNSKKERLHQAVYGKQIKQKKLQRKLRIVAADITKRDLRDLDKSVYESSCLSETHSRDDIDVVSKDQHDQYMKKHFQSRTRSLDDAMSNSSIISSVSTIET